MRLVLSCSVALLVTLVVACNTVDPSDCYPNTSGGFGGSGTIPIGAGVGVGSGDYHTPRWQPLSFPGGANPCVSMGSNQTGDGNPAGGTTGAGAGGASGGGCGTGGYGGLGLGGGGTVVYGGSGGSGAQNGDACFGKPATQYIDCRTRGLNPQDCSEACLLAGTGCGPIAGHPYKTGEGIGQLTWCKNGSPTYTCTYTFASGDACAGVFAPPFSSPYWVCLYK